VAAAAVGPAVVIGAVAEVSVIAGDPVVVVTGADSAGALVSARRSGVSPGADSDWADVLPPSWGGGGVWW
jgi:hypothetical protein